MRSHEFHRSIDHLPSHFPKPLASNVLQLKFVAHPATGMTDALVHVGALARVPQAAAGGRLGKGAVERVDPMKIAVTAADASLESPLDPRFGRCPYLLIVNTDDLSFETLENPNIGRDSGAGIQTAQLVAGRGAQVLLTGNCGPNAYQTLAAARHGIGARRWYGYGTRHGTGYGSRNGSGGRSREWARRGARRDQRWRRACDGAWDGPRW